MPDPSEASARLAKLQRLHHEHCVVCGAKTPHSLGVLFQPEPDGGVSAQFRCEKAYMGYDGCVHGGMLASLLDGAMVSCLFARGLVALTTELQIRYHHPVRIEEPAYVRAWLERSRHRLHWLRGEIRQGERLVTTASAKFLQQPHGAVDQEPTGITQRMP
jgi:uncharacterized protein (TIGR00369 family)